MSTLRSLRKKLTEVYPFGGPKRLSVPEDKIDWNVEWPDYIPPCYTSIHVMNNSRTWADTNMTPDSTNSYKFNEVDGEINRVSHTGKYELDPSGFPLNPAGRTGIAGRGSLGKWGPNHAADTIVTRPKQNPDGTFATPGSTGIFEFIGIQRKDTGEWAIPGGMIDAGEDAIAASGREFYEEVFSVETASTAEKAELEKSFSKLFSSPRIVYRGYVDDPRNTDHAWMETQAVQFHADSPELQQFLSSVTFNAGSDARNAGWLDVSSSLTLYASHKDFIKKMAEANGWDW